MNSETDFVAINSIFKEFASDVAMQIAANTDVLALGVLRRGASYGQWCYVAAWLGELHLRRRCAGRPDGEGIVVTN